MSVIASYDSLVVTLDALVDPASGDLTQSAGSFLKRLRKTDCRVGWFSRSPLRTPQEWADVLGQSKLEVDPTHIVTSTTALIEALREAGNTVCLTVGDGPLRQALLDAEIDLTDDPTKAQAVALGFTRSLDLPALRAAMSAVLSGARLVATDLDTRLVDNHGIVWPSTGATAAYVRAATDIAPEVVGAATRDVYALVAEEASLDGKTLAVSARSAGDLRGAAKLGWDTAFVVGDSWVRLIDSPLAPTWAVTTIDQLTGETPNRVEAATAAQMDDVIRLMQTEGFDDAADGAELRLASTLVALAPSSDGDKVVGCISWEIADNAAHLRGISVDPSERRGGTGSHLVGAALSRLRTQGIEWVYLLVQGGDEFFASLGFWPVAPDRVPEQIADEVIGLADDRRALVRRLR